LLDDLMVSFFFIHSFTHTHYIYIDTRLHQNRDSFTHSFIHSLISLEYNFLILFFLPGCCTGHIGRSRYNHLQQ
jgi:hypothetical protein